MTVSDKSEYTRFRSTSVRINGQDFSIITKPGFSNWEKLTPSEQLLAENILHIEQQNVLILGSRNPASAAFLAVRFPTSRIWIYDFNQIALDAVKETLSFYKAANARVIEAVDIPEDLQGSFDTVLILLPKGRLLARRWLYTAFIALHKGGTCFLAGANREGILPAIHDGEAIFGKSAVLAYKKGSRLVQWTRTQGLSDKSGWWLDSGIRPGEWFNLNIEVCGKAFSLVSLPGIFSYDRLDEGTRLLLESLPNSIKGHAADLGCGYGIIGLFAALHGATSVDLIDSNLIAIHAAEENIRRYNLNLVRAFASDVLGSAAEKRYDLILSNPPFHSGREVDYQIAEEFIRQSRLALQPGGKLIIVANRFIRYERWMEGRVCADQRIRWKYTFPGPDCGGLNRLFQDLPEFFF